MPKRFVYILRSLTVPNRRYVGITADVRARLAAHNSGLSPFTARYRPWSMTVCIKLADERHAVRFERYLKSPSGRAFARRHFAVDGR
jgi:predicted GIY-YIG superfamily endonuclease